VAVSLLAQGVPAAITRSLPVFFLKQAWMTPSGPACAQATRTPPEEATTSAVATATIVRTIRTHHRPAASPALAGYGLQGVGAPHLGRDGRGLTSASGQPSCTSWSITAIATARRVTRPRSSSAKINRPGRHRVPHEPPLSPHPCRIELLCRFDEVGR